MYYIVLSTKSFEQTSADLEQTIKNNGFGLLHIHNLGETLRSKGVSFNEQCKIFEICNPQQASKVLDIDMKLNMALPCRISIYTKDNQTFIGILKPEKILSMLSDAPLLESIAKNVQNSIIKMIDEAK